jgi:lysophospholipase L1-like esterase
VLLGKLLPTADETHNRAIHAINARMDEIAASLSTPESPVVVIDLDRGFAPDRDTYDGIHPNAAGEAKLAEAWFGPLAAIIGSAGPK